MMDRKRTSWKKTLLLMSGIVLMGAACTHSNDNSGTPTVPVAVKTTRKAAARLKGSWTGKWEVLGIFERATLEITSQAGDSVAFSLVASSGAHTGEIAGYAKGNADWAAFLDAQDEDTCLITFQLRSDTLIEVNQQSGLCGAGVGVTYMGAYWKAGTRPPPVETLVTLGVLKNDQEDTQFRNLVGNDYDLFLKSSQLTFEESDLDSLGVQVYTSRVRGLFTLVENIIMTDGQGQLWAAVIDDDHVNYYTNSDAFKETLPQTIEKWRERFADKPVLHKGSNGGGGEQNVP